MDQPSLERIEVQLQTIVDAMESMNRRDRLRTVGGFFRSIISLIPVLLVIWSAWYFYLHGDELMKKLIDQTTSAAASKASTSLTTNDLMKSINVDEIRQKLSMPK